MTVCINSARILKRRSSMFSAVMMATIYLIVYSMLCQCLIILAFIWDYWVLWVIGVTCCQADVYPSVPALELHLNSSALHAGSSRIKIRPQLNSTSATSTLTTDCRVSSTVNNWLCTSESPSLTDGWILMTLCFSIIDRGFGLMGDFLEYLIHSWEILSLP